MISLDIVSVWGVYFAALAGFAILRRICPSLGEPNGICSQELEVSRRGTNYERLTYG